MAERTCRGCGQLFVPRHTQQAYHDLACRVATAPERRRVYRAAVGRAKEMEWLKGYRTRPEVRRKRAQEARQRRLAWYGLTLEEYESLLTEQGGGCAGCGFKGTSQRRLDIDHEHVEDEESRSVDDRRRRVRGLLCHRCNRALGPMHDNAERLEQLAAYVARYEARRATA